MPRSHGQHGAQAGIARWTLYRRIKAEPGLREFIDNLNDEVIDDVEKVLIKCALAGEPWAVRFYLSMRASHRGYAKTLVVEERDQTAVDVEDRIAASTIGVITKFEPMIGG